LMNVSQLLLDYFSLYTKRKSEMMKKKCNFIIILSLWCQ
jgi:hypothetical protein